MKEKELNDWVTERRTTSAVHVVGKNRKEGPILTEHRIPQYSSSGKKQTNHLEFRVCSIYMFMPDQSRTDFFVYIIVIVLETERKPCFYGID